MANIINIESTVITIDGREFTAGGEVTVNFGADAEEFATEQDCTPFVIGTSSTVSGTLRIFVQELDSAGKVRKQVGCCQDPAMAVSWQHDDEGIRRCCVCWQVCEDFR